MAEINIVAYLKPSCGWSNGVRAIFKKYNLEFVDKDIINNADNFQEMMDKSGQHLSPCVEVNGEMLADVSGDEVEEYLVKKELVSKSSEGTDVATDSACETEDHVTMGFKS